MRSGKGEKKTPGCCRGCRYVVRLPICGGCRNVHCLAVVGLAKAGHPSIQAGQRATLQIPEGTSKGRTMKHQGVKVPKKQSKKKESQSHAKIKMCACQNQMQPGPQPPPPPHDTRYAIREAAMP